MVLRNRNIVSRPLSLAAAILVLAACDIGSPIDAVPASLWEGTLSPRGGSGITGSAAAVSQLGTTQLGVLIYGAAAQTSYSWYVREGTCDSPRAVFGAAPTYPSVVTDTEGSASVEFRVSRMMSPRGAYHAVVLREDDEVVLACGDLTGRVP